MNNALKIHYYYNSGHTIYMNTIFNDNNICNINNIKHYNSI